MSPQVSVVMPVRNGARWLAEAVESVLAQTLGDFELLAIDDGSTDDSPRLLDDFARRDQRVRILRQDHRGLVVALNRGIAEARAPLWARLDADDRALPGRLDRQARHLDAHPDIGLLGSWAQIIDEHGTAGRRLTPETGTEQLTRVLARTNPLVHSSIMARTQILRRLGGFRAAFEAAEDYDLWLRVAEVTKIANLPEVLVLYRRHGANVTSRKAIRQAFSVRLAQRSAQARRDSGRDPADDLTAPPDWRSPQAAASYYAEDAARYCLLDLADSTLAANEMPGDLDFSPLFERFADLNHAERRLAARAVTRYAMHGQPADARRTRRLLFRLLREDPKTMMRAVWGLR